MHSFSRKLITEWRRLDLAAEGASLVVGVSGGADSCALLLAVCDLVRRKKLNFMVVAAHFDHALRDESSADTAFVKELAERLGVVFDTERGRVPKTGNIEQNARDARYRYLARAAERHDAFAVLTAHTLNDQAETFLLNLIRGSGPDGLRAMPAKRPLADAAKAILARPLLAWAHREDTVAYCRENDVDPREDAMNGDPRFSRVRIRKTIIPQLAELNPKIVETLARTASLLQDKTEASLPDMVRLPTEMLRSMDDAGRRRMIRDWMIARRGHARQLSSENIAAVERLSMSRKSGRIAELPRGDRVERSGGFLDYRKNKVEKGPSGA